MKGPTMTLRKPSLPVPPDEKHENGHGLFFLVTEDLEHP